MAKVVAEISMSLDGYVTGPDPGIELGLGRGGEPLHTWVFSDDDVDTHLLQEATEQTGAVVMGRRLFDIVDGPYGWSDEVGYAAGLAADPPVFVVTHREPDTVRLKDRFSFVTEGLEAAVSLAKQAAGERNVVVMGGGDVIYQALAGGLADELRIHLAPILLGGGTRLFQEGEVLALSQLSVRVSPNATHLTYLVGPEQERTKR